MKKPTPPKKPPPVKPPTAEKPKIQAQFKPRAVSHKTTGRKPRKKKQQTSPQKILLLTSLEIAGLLISAVTGIVVLLGFAANKFTGTRFFSHLLPFTLGVLALIIAAALLLTGWLRVRRWLQTTSQLLPPAIALAIALTVGGFALQGHFSWAFGHFRTLIGGKEEASRVTLAHQVFAAYRRADPGQLHQLITRAQSYRQDIDAAAEAFALDPDLLHGIAATESSFLPRESKDGGRGLFQITQVPETVLAAAGRHLGVNKPLIADSRHNGYIAAATLKYYLNQMKNDLFLGLLAYNIGPANGGLRFIMQQYGATDFVTIQPYLQQLPRDYPIRVLSSALAFRIIRKEGKLLPYEEGLNAVRIQHIGIPGL
jgi:soluble lytic murein transglycosylase-like protein